MSFQQFISSSEIQVTLWGDKSEVIPFDTLQRSTDHVILVVTSTTVREYKGIIL